MSGKTNSIGSEEEGLPEPNKETPRQWREADPPSEQLYILFLPYQTQEEAIKTFFSPYGEVVRLYVKNNHEKCYSFAYVHFNTVQQATYARKSCGRDFNGKRILVEFARKKGQCYSGKKSSFTPNREQKRDGYYQRLCNRKQSNERFNIKRTSLKPQPYKDHTIKDIRESSHSESRPQTVKKDDQRRDRPRKDVSFYNQSRNSSKIYQNQKRTKEERRDYPYNRHQRRIKEERSRSRDRIRCSKLVKKSVSQSRSVSL